MDWDALGAIGELIGAVAVVATLGYLAIQLRTENPFVVRFPSSILPLATMSASILRVLSQNTQPMTEFDHGAIG